ncbi:MAG TPA: cytochrome P450 [Acidimicrobiia bacterium]|nr:cytochrome P450 [Acidimicrobiia bacterium]
MDADLLTVEEAGRVFADPGAYTDERRFHQACALLRREAPIPLVEADGYPPFYALTRHADVMEAERNPEVFRNLPQPVLMESERERLVRQAGDLATLVHMDDPDHRRYRALTADWFQPSSLARLEARIAELARRAVDRMAALPGECDFAVDIATPMPLEVILSILGLPEADYPKMLQLTRELFQGDDPEFARGSTFEEFMTVIYDYFAYFGALVDERRARPTEDLASVIANAVLDGEPIWPFQQISYFIIIATAGHDTTSFTMTGGLQALIENPGELERLRRDPSLIATAADEMVRWVSPVRHFLRNAVAPADIGGRHFEPGDRLLLSYWSANRDETVFDDPFRFDVGRKPNRHLAFGFGAHYCLGAALARMEIRALFAELVPRLRRIEPAGPPELSRSIFVGGHKHLPVRYALD